MPQDRIHMILEQLERLPLMLASTSQSGRFEASEQRTIVVNVESTDPGRGDDSKMPIEQAIKDIRPDSAAYVIFTSGTTGMLVSFSSSSSH